SVWCLEDIDALGRELVAEGRLVCSLGKRRSRDIPLFFEIARRIRSERIDVLHCHDELAWFYGVIGAGLSIRQLSIVMTMPGRRGDISPRHRCEQRVLAAATGSIVTVSDYLRRQVMSELNLGADKVTTIVNGIDAGGACPAEEDRLRARRLLGL